MLRVVLVFFSLCALVFGIETYSSSSLSLSGEVKYKKLRYFDYANPNAMKGGILRKYAIGSFSSFYAFLPKGVIAEGIELLFDPLMVRSEDEPNSQYGLIAKSIQRASDNSFVIFHLNPEAKFHDNTPITAFDVEFSFNLFAKNKHPIFANHYGDINEVIVVDKYTIRFNFKNKSNAQLAFILGDLRILPKHFFADFDTQKDLLSIPLGSGAYKIASFSDEEIVYERVKDYWAINHPTRVGLFNFDWIVFKYYENEALALEAFKRGEYDFRLENSVKIWEKGYGVNRGIKKESFLHSQPSGMRGLFFNTAKSPFNNILVRKALSLAFNAQSISKSLSPNAVRIKSFFDNSEFASVGVPLGRELEILKAYEKDLPKELFEKPFVSESNAYSLKTARNLLQKENINPFSFEIIVPNFDTEAGEIATLFARNLSLLSIKVSVKVLPKEEYLERLRSLNYDMVVGFIPQGLFVGSEQYAFWHSSSFGEEGGYNVSQLQNLVVDSLVHSLAYAKDYKELLAYVHALDRVLLWEYIAIPLFYYKNYYVAYWDFLRHSSITPLYGLGFSAWWVDADSLEKMAESVPSLKRN